MRRGERRCAEDEQRDRARRQPEGEAERRHVLEAHVAREVAPEDGAERPERRRAERVERRLAAPCTVGWKRVRDAHQPRADERRHEVQGEARPRPLAEHDAAQRPPRSIGCTFWRTTGVTGSPSTNACVNRIVATADEPAPITTAASDVPPAEPPHRGERRGEKRQRRAGRARGARRRRSSQRSSSGRAGAASSASSPQSVAATATNTVAAGRERSHDSIDGAYPPRVSRPAGPDPATVATIARTTPTTRRTAAQPRASPTRAAKSAAPSAPRRRPARANRRRRRVPRPQRDRANKTGNRHVRRRVREQPRARFEEQREDRDEQEHADVVVPPVNADALAREEHAERREHDADRRLEQVLRGLLAERRAQCDPESDHGGERDCRTDHSAEAMADAAERDHDQHDLDPLEQHAVERRRPATRCSRVESARLRRLELLGLVVLLLQASLSKDRLVQPP